MAYLTRQDKAYNYIPATNGSCNTEGKLVTNVRYTAKTFLIILGLLWNGIILNLIHSSTKKFKRAKSTGYVQSIFVTNMMMSLFLVGHKFLQDLNLNTGIFKDVEVEMCDFHAFYLVFFTFATAYNMVAITFDRYECLCSPFKYIAKVNQRTIVFRCSVIFICSIIIAFVPFMRVFIIDSVEERFKVCLRLTEGGYILEETCEHSLKHSQFMRHFLAIGGIVIPISFIFLIVVVIWLISFKNRLANSKDKNSKLVDEDTRNSSASRVKFRDVDEHMTFTYWEHTPDYSPEHGHEQPLDPACSYNSSVEKDKAKEQIKQLASLLDKQSNATSGQIPGTPVDKPSESSIGIQQESQVEKPAETPTPSERESPAIGSDVIEEHPKIPKRRGSNLTKVYPAVQVDKNQEFPERIIDEFKRRVSGVKESLGPDDREGIRAYNVKMFEPVMFGKGYNYGLGEKARTTIILTSLVITYISFWMPFGILLFLYDEEHSDDFAVFEVSYWMACSHTLACPCIYLTANFVFSKIFRNFVERKLSSCVPGRNGP